MHPKETVSDVLDEYGEDFYPKAKFIDREFFERMAEAIARRAYEVHFDINRERVFAAMESDGGEDD
jgi:hypothetical protein